MRGGSGVGVGGGDDLVGLGVDVPETLGWPGDAVGVVQAGVEPLRAVRGGHLGGQHVLDLVLERLSVLGGCEVSPLLSPVPPRGGEAVEDLAGRPFRARHHLTVLVADRFAVLVVLGDAGLAEVLGHHDVCRHLRPVGGDLGALHLEHHGAVRVGDAAVAPRPLDGFIGVSARLRETASDLQTGAHSALLPIGRLFHSKARLRRPNHKMLWSRVPQTPHLGVNTAM